MSSDKSEIVIGMYNSAIDKRGMSPQEAFEVLVKRMHSMKVTAGELQGILGRKSSKMVDFNKEWIGQVGSIYQSLEKKPLTSKQTSEIKKIISIIYLRHLQQEGWENDDDYISYDRLELSAEDYSAKNLKLLVIEYFIKNTNEDYTNYDKDIQKLIDEFRDTNPTIDELKEFAKLEGFKETFIESPDRLTTSPANHNSFKGSALLKKGGVIRFAPTPNGPLHIGHGRGISILSDYADKYNMEFILRFDDTNQDDEAKNSDISRYGVENVYSHIIDDFEWIRGRVPDRVVYASDRKNLDTYERYAKFLIQNDLAYVCFLKDSKYISGTSRGENLAMLDTIINAGESPPFDSAGLLLGMKTGLSNISNIFRMSDSEMKNNIQSWVSKFVYGGNMTETILRGSMNTTDGTKIAGYQRVQNMRVRDRGELQWFWPNLSLQSVIDDKEDGITHIIRGQDYDYEKAVGNYKMAKGSVKKAWGEILYTLRFQSILRVLLNAPPVASTGNWGNVEVKDSNYPTSTSKVKKLIIDGNLDSFMNLELPTIYSLRNYPQNWGSAFKFYWTRFDLPNDLDPLFDRDSYQKLNLEIQEAFSQESLFEHHNSQLIRDISNLQDSGHYLAEDY